MSTPLALCLFHRLCEIANALENLRDTCFYPNTDEWLWHTHVLGMLDAAVDMLARSQGLEEGDAC